MVDACEHLESLTLDGGVIGAAPVATGCVECLASGGSWLHLRRCVACGHVGCCDSSPGKHATAHNGSTGHPVVQSYEPDEEWLFCYVDDALAEFADVPPSPAHP